MKFRMIGALAALVSLAALAGCTSDGSGAFPSAQIAGGTTYDMTAVKISPKPMYTEVMPVSSDLVYVALTSRAPAGFLKMATASTLWLECRRGPAGVYAIANSAKDGSVGPVHGEDACAQLNQPGIASAERLGVHVVDEAFTLAGAYVGRSGSDSFTMYATGNPG